MKCLPICFGVNIEKDIPVFFGAFYKFLYYCQENDWPILAQEEYYEKPTIQEKKYPIKLQEVSKINDIPSIKSIKVKENNKYIITKQETELVFKEYKDKDEAWIKMMNIPNNTLLKILEEKLKVILKNHKQLKYIVIWRHNATIEELCKKNNLSLINMEMAGFRKPSYNFTLCYFQHISKYEEDELNERYEKFLKETKKEKLEMLTRDQLIKLLVSKEEIENMQEEKYYSGFAMGLAKDFDTIATNSKTNADIMEDLAKYEKKSSVLIRKHPSNYHYKYAYENEFTLDKSISSIQFISKCHRIISSVSNISVEAMLFGKTTFILGKMPFKRFGYDSLEYNDEYVISMKDLNFLIFGFFVPYEIALSNEYLEFRDKNPSEIEIYKYHYNYIMNKYGNNLKRRGIKERYQQWIDNKKFIDDLKVHSAETDKELQSILYSRSWKMLAPLRKIKTILKRKN